MLSAVAFDVFGTPMPKGSYTKLANGAVINARRGPAAKLFREWTTAIELAARYEMGHERVQTGRTYMWLTDRKPLDGALSITVMFWFRRNKSETRAQRLRTFHTSKPDVDKLLRAVLDPLKEIVITDDSRIAIAHVTKRYVPHGSADLPRACISIASLEETA